ncbi:porin family protein [Desulfopila aestuarii]|uniref:Putative beta-barrel porin 2 n=1 Tax=Desulfopila aestuarii DSM 18488 TaxID=1121416 RepID=A0A1M7Y2D3_9BACT|nr:outer membrane beta-barrel protein [Desulfopila aestuarii]SHO46108.1 Putative beta-barrel porin 2 [Desulfopila aestuarii DSM 18488]
MNIKILPLGVAVCLSMSAPLSAAVNTISAGVSTGYEYFDRNYDNSNSPDDDDYSRLRVSPFITIISETERQSLDFTYAPSFWYDFDESEDDIDHKLSLEYLRMLTRYWNVSLADNLSITDEFNSYSPTTDPETGDIVSGGPGADVAGDTLRDQNGRRRYTNNSLSLGTMYTYYEDSSVSFDYVWAILRNDSDYSGSDYQDYDKHDFGLTVNHKINSKWRVTTSAGFIRGLYDSVENDSGSAIPADSDDVDEYRGSLSLNYRLNPLHALSGAYSYNLSDYDSNLRSDSEIHNVTLGWVWDVSPRLNLSFGAGPSYSKQDGQSGNWGSNENFGLNYTLEKGSVGLTAAHGFRFDNFDGTDQKGSTEFWNMQTSLQHAFTEYISGSAYASFAKEDSDESSENGTPSGFETVNSKVYATGLSVNYRFLEDYTAGISYGFVHYTSGNNEDDYDDHRASVTISYENELFQW